MEGPLSRSLKDLFEEHEDVLVVDDASAKCTSIIAIHNTNLGPALGGCRRFRYQGIYAALFDVARLSRGMTYKAALIGIKLGGGKAVLVPWDDDEGLRSERYLSMGRVIESLGGRYISGEDVGTGVEDAKTMLSVTKHVGGVMEGHPYGGDPSPITAIGVDYALRGGLSVVYPMANTSDLSGFSVYIEGLGKVGYALAERLAKAGMRLYVSNRIDKEEERQALRKAMNELNATVVELTPKNLPVQFPPVEVYAPCALGGSVNPDRIATYPSTLRLICGAANNQLLDPDRDGADLMKRGVYYVPDYLANNRGLWDIYCQMSGGYDLGVVEAGCRENEGLAREVLLRSDKQKVPSHRVADEMAEANFMAKRPRARIACGPKRKPR